MKEQRDTYSATFWLNGKTEDTLQRSFADIAQRLLIEHPYLTQLKTAVKVKKPDQIVAAIKQWLSIRKNTRWILVFDNVDNPKLPGIENPQAYDVRFIFS